jgi:hypothetical protein
VRRVCLLRRAQARRRRPQRHAGRRSAARAPAAGPRAARATYESYGERFLRGCRRGEAAGVCERRRRGCWLRTPRPHAAALACWRSTRRGNRGPDRLRSAVDGAFKQFAAPFRAVEPESGAFKNAHQAGRPRRLLADSKLLPFRERAESSLRSAKMRTRRGCRRAARERSMSEVPFNWAVARRLQVLSLRVVSQHLNKTPGWPVG